VPQVVPRHRRCGPPSWRRRGFRSSRSWLVRRSFVAHVIESRLSNGATAALLHGGDGGLKACTVP
jgi:hypothetical protein